jgi:hypothetical protein
MDAPNSKIESFLSLYVDFGLTLQLEKQIQKSGYINCSKQISGILVCPLFKAIQPPWCPSCGGKLHYVLEKNIINYEPFPGLNQNCPIVKEWIGKKLLIPSKQ